MVSPPSDAAVAPLTAPGRRRYRRPDGWKLENVRRIWHSLDSDLTYIPIWHLIIWKIGESNECQIWSDLIRFDHFYIDLPISSQSDCDDWDWKLDLIVGILENWDMFSFKKNNQQKRWLQQQTCGVQPANMAGLTIPLWFYQQTLVVLKEGGCWMCKQQKIMKPANSGFQSANMAPRKWSVGS
jgi:hypothetical protein